MILYNFLFSSLVLLRYTLAGEATLRRHLYPPVLAALFFFAAFRYEVGCDWPGYYNQFRVVASGETLAVLIVTDPLWWLIIESIAALGLSFLWLNVASAVIFFLGMHALARRQPDPLGFVVLLFPIMVVNMPMSGIRQAAAIGLICLAYTSFMDRRTIRFIAFTVVAALIHFSAIIFLLFAPLVGGGFTRARVMLAIVLAIPGAIALAGTEPVQIASERYIESAVDSAGAIYRVGLVSLAGAGFLLLLRPHWREVFPEDYRLVLFGSLAMVALPAALPVSSVIADRLGYYLIPLQCAVFARIPFLRITSWQPLLTAAPYLLLLLVFLVWTMTSYHFAACYVPYRSWLFGLPMPAGASI